MGRNGLHTRISVVYCKKAGGVTKIEYGYGD